MARVPGGGLASCYFFLGLSIPVLDSNCSLRVASRAVTACGNKRGHRARLS